MRCYEAVPDDGASAAVVVVQEAFGVNDHIEDVTRRFADGRVPRRRARLLPPRRAAAPRRTATSGSGDAARSARSAATPRCSPTSTPRSTICATQGFADEHIGIVGFCFGGRVTFLVVAAPRARRRGRLLRRRHRHRALPAVPAARRAQRVVADAVARPVRRRGRVDSGRGRRAAARRARAAPVDTEVVRYADAEHGFHCDVRADYHAEAAADAWAPHPRLVRQVPLGAATPFSHPFHLSPASRRCRDRARCSGRCRRRRLRLRGRRGRGRRRGGGRRRDVALQCGAHLSDRVDGRRWRARC